MEESLQWLEYYRRYPPKTKSAPFFKGHCSHCSFCDPGKRRQLESKRLQSRQRLPLPAPELIVPFLSPLPKQRRRVRDSAVPLRHSLRPPTGLFHEE